MTRGPQPISALIITHNEEDNLERCLISLQGVFNEIVIIDSGSTDNTVEIASRFGIKPIYHKFSGFGDQKRFAVLSARNDYVFSIDADEELSPELKNSILSIENIEDHDAYLINRLSSCDGQWIRHSGWHPDWLVRLWNKRKGNYNQDLVHETVNLEKGFSKTRLEGLLMHYSIGNLADHFSKISKYEVLKVKSKKRIGKPGFLASVVKGKLKFFKIFVLKLGILDGRKGFRIAAVSSLGYIIQYATRKKDIQADSNRKKVCFINTTPVWSSDEIWLLDAAIYMKKKGMEVFTITANGSPLCNRFQHLGISVFPFTAKRLTILNPYRIRRLMRYFNEHSIQKVLINTTEDLRSVGLAAWLAGVPEIIFISYNVKLPDNNTLNTFYLTSVVTQILANSHETFDHLTD